MNSIGASSVPTSLAEWSFESIKALCSAGYSESDRHDFKFGLPESKGLTKVACAFANTFGGYVVLGVKEKNGHTGFQPIGIEPNSEIYGEFLNKIRAEPEIGISYPKLISVPSSSKFLYVFEIFQSTRRPHLPSKSDERIFWKRVGSDCCQMTLEEIRQQMLMLEEKREKLSLLLIDLFYKLQSLKNQENAPDGHYDGDMFTFETIDRIVVESYSLLRCDVKILEILNLLRSRFSLLNVEKHQLFSFLTLSYERHEKIQKLNRYRSIVRNVRPELENNIKELENLFEEQFSIVNPFKNS